MTAQFNDALTRIVSLCVDEYENMTHGVSYFLYQMMIHVQLFTTRLTPYLRPSRQTQSAVCCMYCTNLPRNSRTTIHDVACARRVHDVLRLRRTDRAAQSVNTSHITAPITYPRLNMFSVGVFFVCGF